MTNYSQLKETESAVIGIMRDLGICTKSQVADKAGFDVTSAMRTLHQKGLIHKAGRAGHTWRWTL